MSQVCFICSEPLTESGIVVVDRGMKTLIEASVERNDGFHEYLKNKKSVTIHVHCRKVYTRKTTIAAAKRQREMEKTTKSITNSPPTKATAKRQREPKNAAKSTISPPPTKARLTESSFYLKKCCLFCGKEANKEAEKKKALDYRHKIHQVSTLAFRETILKLTQTRSDEVAKAVRARIENENDLIAAEAKYHSKCHLAFLKPTTGGKVGRPKDDYISLAMDEIFAYIENNDNSRFSLQELKDICKNTDIDNRTIKRRLKLKYGNKIIITENQGKLTFIYFIDKQKNIQKEVQENENRMETKNELES